jgi:hypothetical protein
LNVAAGAGISVPVPGAADIVGLLQHHRGEAGLAQPVQEVQAGEPGSHDRNVDQLRRTAARRSQRRCCAYCVWHATSRTLILLQATSAHPVCHQDNCNLRWLHATTGGSKSGRAAID